MKFLWTAECATTVCSLLSHLSQSGYFWHWKSAHCLIRFCEMSRSLPAFWESSSIALSLFRIFFYYFRFDFTRTFQQLLAPMHICFRHYQELIRDSPHRWCQPPVRSSCSLRQVQRHVGFHVRGLISLILHFRMLSLLHFCSNKLRRPNHKRF